MISEGSCDTEDWCNAANSALYYKNKLHLKFSIENSYFKFNNIFFVSFYSIFDQIYTALVSRRGFFQTHLGCDFGSNKND